MLIALFDLAQMRPADLRKHGARRKREDKANAITRH